MKNQEEPSWNHLRWWRAVGANGELLAETSDPDDFAELGMLGKPGVTVQRLYERSTLRWVDEKP